MSLSTHTKVLQSDIATRAPVCLCCGSVAAPVSFQFYLSSWCSSCCCFRARDVVSVVCSIALSKGIKPFILDLARAAT